jgi:hypothetical protein
MITEVALDRLAPADLRAHLVSGHTISAPPR